MSICSVALFLWIHIPTVYLLPTFSCFLASDFTERFGDTLCRERGDLYFHFPSITSSSAPFAQRLHKSDWCKASSSLLARGTRRFLWQRSRRNGCYYWHQAPLPFAGISSHTHIHCFLLTLLTSKISPLLPTASHRKLIEGSLIQFRSSCEPCIIFFFASPDPYCCPWYCSPFPLWLTKAHLPEWQWRFLRAERGKSMREKWFGGELFAGDFHVKRFKHNAWTNLSPPFIRKKKSAGHRREARFGKRCVHVYMWEGNVILRRKEQI